MDEIYGHTQLYGLLADPAKHSLSPKIMNTGFNINAINARYLAFEVKPETFGSVVAGMKAAGIQGFNLSMPFKRSVLPLLDDMTERAQRLQSVNVVKRQGIRLIGDTVDGQGFVHNLRRHGCQLTNKRVVILGAGGAGRSVIEALSHESLAQLTVIKRNNASYAKVAQLLDTLAVAGNTPLKIMDYTTANISQALGEVDIVINSTNIGMKTTALPFDEKLSDLVTSKMIVADMIYAPRKTTLLKLAADRGATAIDGVGMLLGQAEVCFEWWTGGQHLPMEMLETI